MNRKYVGRALSGPAFVVALLAASSASAQQPAAVQGVVVKWTTGEPVAKADIELRPASEAVGAPYVAKSDASGAFRFASVTPGSYRLVAKRAGYVDAEYGQRRPGGAAVTLTLSAAQSIAVQVAISPAGVIAGRVEDRSGQPLGNADVQAFKSSYRDGRRVLTRVQITETNDLGEYRLFGLTPGRYYVGTTHPDSGDFLKQLRMAGMGIGPQGASRSSGDNAGLTGANMLGPRRQTAMRTTVYYPGTSDEQAAAPFDVAPGSELSGVDLIVDLALRHVRGRVIYEATGEPARSAVVQAVSPGGVALAQPGEGPAGFGAADNDEGMFDLTVPTGSHVIVATVQNLVGRLPIQVGEADLDNLTLALSAGFTVSGRITVDGRPLTAAEIDPFRVSLVPDPPVVRDFGPYSVPVGNGSLTLAAGRGDFRVSVDPLLSVGPPRPGPPSAGLPPSLDGAYVKSIQLGSTDILNGRLHLEGVPDVPLVITLGTATGTLDGRVVNSAREPVPNAIVALLPDAARQNRADLIRSSATDLAGRFRFERVPPGDYRLFAWEDIESGAWQDPDQMRPFEDRGTPLRVDERGRVSLDISAIQ